MSFWSYIEFFEFLHKVWNLQIPASIRQTIVFNVKNSDVYFSFNHVTIIIGGVTFLK